MSTASVIESSPSTSTRTPNDRAAADWADHEEETAGRGAGDAVSRASSARGGERPFPKDHAIYKPNSRGSGGAVRWQLNRDKGALFLEAARQSGERQFDWERKIIMKWGMADIGQVLAVLQGRQPQAKVFHQAERANSAFDLSRRDDPDKAPYVFSVSRQEAADKTVCKVTIPLTHGEVALLETVLRTAVTRLLGW